MKPQQNFLYLNWDANRKNQRLKFGEDATSSVEVISSVGPYKNNYADVVLEKNNVYYWEIKIIKGNYFKIGIMKESVLAEFKGKAFSDNPNGYAYFSAGKLRNGSNTTGVDFNGNQGYGPGDIIGVEFNSKKGTLSFSKNNDVLKVAFTVPEFKKGGYVPAIATLIEGTKYALTLPDLED